VLKRGWSAIKTYFAEREKRRLAAMEETERMDFEKRKLARQAEKLERKLKKKGDGGPRRVDETPGPEVPEPRIIDATYPLEKRPSLAEIESGRKKKNESKPSLAGLRLENYQLPPIDLLDPLDDTGRRPADHDELRSVQAVIIETLAHFGIKAKAGDITRGPTITRFEVYPDSGVRVDRITSLERDIARATRAQRINILAPIPGKDTVGIEIANSSAKSLRPEIGCTPERSSLSPSERTSMDKRSSRTWPRCRTVSSREPRVAERASASTQ
jgi:S-DNA-T family DNA segregation ATPase FtsK/SpoIIIE